MIDLALIKERRLNRRLKASQFGKVLGITGQHYGYLEAGYGKKGGLTVNDVQKLLPLIGTTIWDFIVIENRCMRIDDPDCEDFNKLMDEMHKYMVMDKGEMAWSFERIVYTRSRIHFEKEV